MAQQLAARINIPNVMQTDVMCDLLRASDACPIARQPLWARTDLGSGSSGTQAAAGGAGSSGGEGGEGGAAGAVGAAGGVGDASLLAEFKRECRVVRQAMQGDLVKVGWQRG